jgi:SPP1 gp7 family putative phage head morphogenesis protein
MEKIRELKPVKISTEDFDEAERRIKELFKREIYFPLLAELREPKSKLENAKPGALEAALRFGKVTFYRGTFSGKFNAEITRELRGLGAKYDRREGTYKLPISQIPSEYRSLIAASDDAFKRMLGRVDERLRKILPEEISDKLKVADAFDSALYKTEKDFIASVKNISIVPKLTPEQRKKIADEWQNNMKLYIADFTKKEIVALREKMQKAVFKGNRYEAAVGVIQKSFGVSADKAKFLARQETALLLTKYKETRYTDAGVHEYKWGCVHMPKDSSPRQHKPGNVRYSHGILEGKIFRWDDPPVTTAPGEPVRRNNPGADFNCRCFARPIVRFREKE